MSRSVLIPRLFRPQISKMCHHDFRPIRKNMPKNQGWLRDGGVNHRRRRNPRCRLLSLSSAADFPLEMYVQRSGFVATRGLLVVDGITMY